MVLNKDFKEFIELLNAHKVKYLVIGGYAVTYHGYPRYTKDIDFWIWLDKENVKRLVQVINSFGFGSLGLKESDFSDPENIIQLGQEPNRIDLLVDLDGPEFEECYKRREEIESEGFRISIIGVEDLIKIKKQIGRYQDLADAEQLEKIKNKNKRNDGT